MPSWFSKVFQKSEGELAADLDATPEHAVALEEEEMPRRIVQAPILRTDTDSSTDAGSIRVKARMEPGGRTLALLVDRPVLRGYSIQCKDPETARDLSPLASALFDLGGLSSVSIHEATVRVELNSSAGAAWEDRAKELGAQIRAHLKSGMPVLNPEFMDRIPPEETIRQKLQEVIDLEINPGIASHSGVITLNRVVGNTAYITMGGGCQGCAASSITLRQGVESAFRGAVPALGALLDETDHGAGENPFFTQVPAGMEA